MNNNEIITLENITKVYTVKGKFGEKRELKALDNVSLSIKRGETLGLVGESGCGKSTLAKVLMQLAPATKGNMYFAGEPIISDGKRPKKAVLEKLYRKEQMVFQNPYYSLNPSMTVEQLLSEPFIVHKVGASRAERREKILELLDIVGLDKEYIDRYPHEFSGGQRQRIGIARAIAIKPEVVICDEAVSALDVSIQSQILNLLVELQKSFGLTYLFVSHDLSVVKYISDRIVVMYLGKIMELAETTELYENTQHPYTLALLSAIPTTKNDAQIERIRLEGDIASAANLPKGCRFASRCWRATERCKNVDPDLVDVGGGHMVACHWPGPERKKSNEAVNDGEVLTNA